MSRLDLISIDRANDMAHAKGGWVPDGLSPIDHWRMASWTRRVGYVVGVLVLAIVVVVLTAGLLAMGPG